MLRWIMMVMYNVHGERETGGMGGLSKNYNRRSVADGRLHGRQG